MSSACLRSPRRWPTGSARILWLLLGGLLFECAEPEARRAHFIPTLSAPLRRVYAPAGTRYLNDHTIVRDDSGTFHVFGITDESQGKPSAENQFLHATAARLEGPWTDQADALVADPVSEGCCIWAPFVTRDRDGWIMYYNATVGERVLRRADSTDLVTWKRTERWAEVSRRPPGGRDPFVLLANGRRYLYSVGVLDDHGQIVVTSQEERDDTSAWSELVPVITDPEPVIGWGNLESPFVVRYEGLYYLFLTRTLNDARRSYGYFNTLVFVSDRLDHWDWQPITELRAHAAEIIQHDGQWFLTSGGWTVQTGEAMRGLSIAPFSWRPAGPGACARGS